MIALPKGWLGRRAEAWTGRATAVALFRSISEEAACVAYALDRHADLDALCCFRRMVDRVAEASKLSLLAHADPAKGRRAA